MSTPVTPWVGTEGGSGAGARETPGASPARVLIVDDDPQVQDAVDDALEHAPYTVGRAWRPTAAACGTRARPATGRRS